MPNLDINQIFDKLEVALKSCMPSDVVVLVNKPILTTTLPAVYVHYFGHVPIPITNRRNPALVNTAVNVQHELKILVILTCDATNTDENGESTVIRELNELSMYLGDIYAYLPAELMDLRFITEYPNGVFGLAEEGINVNERYYYLEIPFNRTVEAN